MTVAHPIPMQAVGWSPTTWVSFIGSSGIVGAIVVLITKIQKNNNDRAKQDGDLEGQRWDRLMALVNTQAERIEALERGQAEQVKQAALDLSEERRRCDQEISDLRKDHAKEIADVRQELAAVYRTISANAVSAGRMFEPRGGLPEDIKDKLRMLEQRT